MSRMSVIVPLVCLAVCTAKPQSKGIELSADVTWSVNGIAQKPLVRTGTKDASVNLEHLFSFPVQGDWLINTKSIDYWLMMISSKRIIPDSEFTTLDRAQVYERFRAPRTFPIENIERHQLTFLKDNREIRALNQVSGSFTVRAEKRGQCGVMLFSMDAVFADGAKAIPVHADGFSSECPGT